MPEKGTKHVHATNEAEMLADEAGDHLIEYKAEGLGQCRNCPRTAHFRVTADNNSGEEEYCATCLAILHGHESYPPSGRFVEDAA